MRIYRWKAESEFANKPIRSGVQPGPPELQREAEIMSPVIKELETALKSHRLSPVDFVGGYLLAYCQCRTKNKTRSILLSRRKTQIEIDAADCDHCDVEELSQTERAIPPPIPVLDIPGLCWSEKDREKLTKESTVGAVFREWQIQGESHFQPNPVIDRKTRPAGAPHSQLSQHKFH